MASKLRELLLFFLWVLSGASEPRPLGLPLKSRILDGLRNSALSIAPVVMIQQPGKARMGGSFIDMSRLREEVNSGMIHVKDSFIQPDEVAELREDIEKGKAEGYFKSSGLSNSAKALQNFDPKSDRSVAPVLGDSGYTSEPLLRMKRRLMQLQGELAVALNRPTLTNQELDHELYYSSSKPGARLPRHMDVRHPELSKRGYTGASRRSLSFLVYLSDPEWDEQRNNGVLRAYPQQGVRQHADVGGSFEGCLMVAWLVERRRGSAGEKFLSQVFLDTWKVDPVDGLPRCQLFRVKPRFFGAGGYEREPLSGLFDIPGGSAKSVMTNLKPFLYPRFASDRSLEVLQMEDLTSELPDNTAVMDISPVQGRLVVFDSAMVPHQVEAVKEGERLALAGWFHEASSIPPKFRA